MFSYCSQDLLTLFNCSSWLLLLLFTRCLLLLTFVTACGVPRAVCGARRAAAACSERRASGERRRTAGHSSLRQVELGEGNGLERVDAFALLRLSEKAMPATENSRLTVADGAGQPRYCRAMRARFGKRLQSEHGRERVSGQGRGQLSQLEREPGSNAHVLLAAHHLSPHHSPVFSICGSLRYSPSSSSCGMLSWDTSGGFCLAWPGRRAVDSCTDYGSRDAGVIR